MTTSAMGYVQLLLVLVMVVLLVDLQFIQCGKLARNEETNTDSSKDGSTLGKPTNLTISCLNLNYTLYWDPPIGASEDDDIRYTVNYFKLGQGFIQLPHCINLTQHTCYLFPVFNTHDDVLRDLRVSVHAHDRAGNKRGPTANVTFNPLTNATVGAPSITIPSDTIGPFEVAVHLKPPVTPIDGRPITTQLTEMTIKYNISVWRQSTKIAEKLVVSSHDTAYFSTLQPDTSYNIRAFTTHETMYGVKTSPDRTIVSFKTKQKRPNIGPDVFLRRISEPNCSQPNLRNITINWKPPPVASWNGQITNYTLFWRERDRLHVTYNRVIVQSQLSYTIENLSRWKVYEISVSANNNGGGATSAWMTIPADIINKQSSAPEDLQVEEEFRDSSIQLSWKPPSDNTECIVGYRVTYQWEGVDGKQVQRLSVHNTSYHMEGLEPAIYTIDIAPEIRSGDKNYTLGLAATISYPQTGNNGRFVVKWQPLVAVLVVVILVSIGLWVCLWQRAKVKRILGMHNLFHLDDNNTILKFAQNYNSPRTPPATAVEPELFDAIVTTRDMCPNTGDSGICSEISCSSSTTSNEHCDKERRSCEKLITLRQLLAESGSPELPNLTPDIGFSCFHFPDFSRKASSGKLLLENQPLVKSNDYNRLNSGESSQVQSSISMNDLYLQVNKPETDMDSEASKLLPDTAQVSPQKSTTDINPYCQVSQIPPMRNIKYSRLNSYSDTDVSADLSTAEVESAIAEASSSKYDDGNDLEKGDNLPQTGGHQGKQADNRRPEIKRMDSYPYVKLAAKNGNTFDSIPLGTFSACIQKDNCPMIPPPPPNGNIVQAQFVLDDNLSKTPHGDIYRKGSNDSGIYPSHLGSVIIANADFLSSRSFQSLSRYRTTFLK